jgi:hypothetical protein
MYQYIQTIDITSIDLCGLAIMVRLQISYCNKQYFAITDIVPLLHICVTFHYLNATLTDTWLHGTTHLYDPAPNKSKRVTPWGAWPDGSGIGPQISGSGLRFLSRVMCSSRVGQALNTHRIHIAPCHPAVMGTWCTDTRLE